MLMIMVMAMFSGAKLDGCTAGEFERGLDGASSNGAPDHNQTHSGHVDIHARALSPWVVGRLVGQVNQPE